MGSVESGFDPRPDEGGEVDDNGRPRRTGTLDVFEKLRKAHGLQTNKQLKGTMWTASAHIITAIIGSGVLWLSWSMAELGWIAGMATLLIFSCITYYTSRLLADCYRFPNFSTGRRNYTYKDAVHAYLGRSMYKACGLEQCVFLCGSAIGYTITAATSMVAIRRSNCFHKKGHEAPCQFSNNWYILGMGIAEISVSQIPNFNKLSWLSVIASTMSFTYASIGLELAFAKVISGKGKITSITRFEVGGDKIWSSFRAVGDVALACTYSPILIEIQDTLRSSPPENKEMKKANAVAVLTSTDFYVMCSCFGYAAFGNIAAGNMLTGFGFYEPFWLIDLASVCIVVHLVGAYQVLSQPVYSTIESWPAKRWPNSKTVFVMAATLIAMAVPFFNEALALLGAIGYWPMTVYFPVEMYIAQKKIRRRTIRWVVLQLLNLGCLVIAICAACGAIQGLHQGLQTYEPFKLKDQPQAQETLCLLL